MHFSSLVTTIIVWQLANNYTNTWTNCVCELQARQTFYHVHRLSQRFSGIMLPMLRMFQCKILFSCCRGGLRHRRAKDHPDGSFSALWDGADWGAVQIHLHGCAALHRNIAETHRGGTGVQQEAPHFFTIASFCSHLLTFLCFLLCRKVRLKGASTPTLSTLCLTWLEESRALCLLALLFLLPPAQSE